MSKYIITFPGQGSQSIGMMNSLAHIPIIKKTFSEASEILNKDFWAMTSSENQEINQTVNTQPLMLTAGVASWRYLQENNLASPSFIAGHSLGEFTALVAANSLTFHDALKIVTKRAQLMQNAVPENEGAMAAIIGLEDQDVIKICAEEQGNGVLEAVNFNSPGQVVVAGTKDVLEESLQSFKDAGAKRAMLLPVSVPSHCKLMQPASILFGDYLNQINFNLPEFPVIQNFKAIEYNEIEKIKFALVHQLFNPVMWTQSIKYLSSKGINLFIEAGPGKILTGLNKRINKEASHVSMISEEAINEILLKLKEST
ncbi:ACP S-malonyltransferase [Methylophilaceae bacterium]|jgi:[acyl-carrier-protein] S-malonyltransferase|nr:ACP S-malonyltransferase [Methylophilaceae bacterium]|tara:strand:+ start:991 stop:1929 length:939 start_codon:yes stop_codon:yes gene_type:complete